MCQEFSPAKDFGDTSMGDPELSGDVAWSDPLVCHVHNPLTDNVGERTSIDKDPSKLVDTPMACKERILVVYFRAQDDMGQDG